MLNQFAIEFFISFGSNKTNRYIATLDWFYWISSIIKITEIHKALNKSISLQQGMRRSPVALSNLGKLVKFIKDWWFLNEKCTGEKALILPNA